MFAIFYLKLFPLAKVSLWGWTSQSLFVFDFFPVRFEVDLLLERLAEVHLGPLWVLSLIWSFNFRCVFFVVWCLFKACLKLCWVGKAFILNWFAVYLSMVWG